MERLPKYSFDSAQLDQAVAHGGKSPILTQRVFVGDPTSSIRFIDYSLLPPGSDIGRHTHETDNEELYLIVAGRGAMFVDGKTFEVGCGDCVVNRPGGTHGLENTGDTELKMIVIEVVCRSHSIAKPGSLEGSGRSASVRGNELC
jgi:mannose-6-phosphate isomerase-like protein (cupin superfamily)